MSSRITADADRSFAADFAALDCLDDETIVALAEGALKGEARTTALRHLEVCATCSALVGQAARLRSADRPKLGRYRVVEEIGVGGMGRVHLAHDPMLDRDVALKVVALGEIDPRVGAERLRREAQTLARLDHPSICKVFDVQQQDEVVFIAMELVRGRTLAAWLAERPAPRAIVETFARAGEGLAAAHAADVVHRDFKPSNAMIEDASDRVVVLDFGLARRQYGRTAPDGAPTSESSRRTSSALAGTPIYMAPEQYDGVATAASDQYAFCLALLEGLVGRFPLEHDHGAALRRAKLGRLLAPGVVEAVPAPLRAALLRGLEPKPQDRWPDMHALIAALHRPPRRIWPMAVACGALALTTMGAALARPSTIDCDRADESVAAVWNDARRGALRDAFATADSHAVVQRVEAKLDEHAQHLSEASRAACEVARDRGGAADPGFDARAHCRARRLRELEAAVSTLETIDPQAASSALLVVDDLVDVARCDDDAILSVDPLPDDPRLAARVEAVESALTRANNEVRVGRYREALALYEAVVDDAHETGWDPIEAEALAGLAVVLRKLDDPRAAAVAEDAHVRARLIRDYASAATSAIELAHVMRRQGRIVEAVHWVEEAELDADRANVPRLRAYALEAKAAIAYARNELQAALDMRREAVELHASIDPRGRAYALALGEVATTLRRLERFDEALEMLGRAREILVALYGEDSPRLAEVEFEMGAVHLVRGDAEAAIPLFERNLPLVERKSGEHSRGMLSARTGLASAYREAGQLGDAAEQSRRAIAILEHIEHSPREAVLAWLNYGKVLALQGEHEDALAAYDESRLMLETMEENAAQQDLLGIVLEHSADVLDALGRSAEAQALRARASTLQTPED